MLPQSSFTHIFLNLKPALRQLIHEYNHKSSIVKWMWKRRRARPGGPVYMLDYACFIPPKTWRISHAAFLEHATLHGMSERNQEFQKKIIQHSGLSELTSLPPSFTYIPCRKNLRYAREESALTFFSMLDDLFGRILVDPKIDIKILVVNCCLFYPSPSLTSLLVNRYKMRSDIKTFNLSGMGCAASLLAIDMAKHLLWAQAVAGEPTYALVVSSENMSGRDYLGGKRSMLVANCLFRSGGAAVLLSNRRADRFHSKYKLLHTIRTNTSSDDSSFTCITHGEDEYGHIGISLSKDLMSVAARALTTNMTSMAPLVLPASEMVRYALNHLARCMFKAQWKAYSPDFKKAFNHFCIHAGGKAIIQELQKSLKLSEQFTEASTMTLYRFGNTSSTSVWYELAYLEAMLRVKKGDRIWQVGLGSGFKCFSAVWESAWDSYCTPSNPWQDNDGLLAALYPANGSPTACQ